MRKMLLVLALLFLAACGGDEAADVEVSPIDDGAGERAALAPPLSIPVSEISANHVDPPVSFDQSPSIGGDHYPFWQNCGFYTVELIEGAATHTMEHGAVWITYNADKVSEAELSTLSGMAADNGKLLISPYPHAEKLVLSAWGVQQRTELAPQDSAVADFIEEWVDNPDLPEAGVRCTDAAGIPPNDVRSLVDGTQVPAEFE